MRKKVRETRQQATTLNAIYQLKQYDLLSKIAMRVVPFAYCVKILVLLFGLPQFGSSAAFFFLFLVFSPFSDSCKTIWAAKVYSSKCECSIERKNSFIRMRPCVRVLCHCA